MKKRYPSLKTQADSTCLNIFAWKNIFITFISLIIYYFT